MIDNNTNDMKAAYRHSLRWLLGIAIAATATLTACSDNDDDNSNNGNGGNPAAEVVTFDDLGFFQNAIIEVDSVGDMMTRYYGMILDEAEPEHLYIGVDNLAQAETLFRQWLAPDVEPLADMTAKGALTCPLTDEEGKSQGTIYFTPGNGASVAEVTASADTNLRHFNKITFLANDAWPTNDEDEPVLFHEGDIISHIFDFSRDPNDNQPLNFVCVRQASKGVKPLFCAITRYQYYRPSYVSTGAYVPNVGQAKAISTLLSSSWDFYADCFNRAACGKLEKGQAYWIKEEHATWFKRFYGYIYYESGAIYGAEEDEFPLPYLVKIDWLDDSAIKCQLTATSGVNGVRGDEYYQSAFDGDTGTKWCTHTNNKQNGAWFVEFNSRGLVNPKAVKMVTANDAAKYKGRNPKSWKLYAKGDLSEKNWKLICENADSRMTDINCKEYVFMIDPAKRDEWMYFRLEITDNQGADVMSVSEISFVLD